jgi:uncharacterized protein (DUF1684 family)
MKKVILFLFLVISTCFFAQVPFDKNSVLNFQKELNASYADKRTSPLTTKDLKNFKKLDFFPSDKQFFVIAQFIRTPNEQPFEMPTSTKRKPMYIKYGEAHFVLKGKKLKLNVYRNLEFSNNPSYKDNLFLPFTDLTSGVESYGGGRYIDLKIPSENTIIIDFNKAYNPYCAYNQEYSCPIPPEENALKVKIYAGVKKFH